MVARICILLAFVFWAGISHAQIKIDDVSRLNETAVSAIRQPLTEVDIQQAVRDAHESGKKISIAGRRHSQGGHIMAEDAIVLDMTGFNKILDLSSDKKVLKVQSGVTWAQIQEFLNAQGLAVEVQQSSNIFTVGGSLSANVHGRDPRFGPIIGTVRSLRVVTADGDIVTVSREMQPALFSLVIGGYGLFGVITEAELEVTRNSVLKRETSMMDCQSYPAYLRQDIWGKDHIEIHFARPDITRENFMSDCLVTSYRRDETQSVSQDALGEESLIEESKRFLDLSRKHDWGKTLRWQFQKLFLDEIGMPEIISRNNAMRPPVAFLDYSSPENTDILQEYFIPLADSVSFMEDLKRIVKERNINVLSVTLRSVEKDTESFLPYAQHDSLAFVLYINHGKDAVAIEQVRTWTQELIDAALKNGGTYYLTYANYATPEQIRAAYPMLDNFFERKNFYDPDGIFMNKFYQHYAGE